MFDIALDDPRRDRRHVDLVPLVVKDDEFAGDVALEGRCEQLVNVAHERGTGTPARLQGVPLGIARGQAVQGVEHERGVAAPELVDGLLDIADEDGRVGQRGELQEQRQLHGIGVLKLVHEEQLELPF